MTEFKTITGAKDGLEMQRQEQLKDILQGEGLQTLEQFRPGTFGCHELLDRTAMVNDLLERFITSHPACLGNPEWYTLARQATEALSLLYQKIGAEHLEQD